MNKLIFPLFFSVFFVACNNSKGPDVSGIKISVSTQRFDQDFFSIDSNNVAASIPGLGQKYPVLLPYFLDNVIGLGDASPQNNFYADEVKRFIHLNRPVYDSVQVQFKNIDPLKNEFEKAFQYVKYYYPEYKIPKLVTVVGPVDALAQMRNGDMSTCFLGPDLLAVGLQFYLGKDFSIYHAEYFINNVAPLFRSRRFSKEYITADAMKVIADDISPDKSSGKSLIEQMIEKGKQWYLLDHLMPFAPDSIKTGYTQKQLDWCKEYEGLIWTEIVRTENLYSIEPSVIQTYIGESPTTQGMPADSPGNIGPWVGWQIVKKYAGNSNASLQDVMKADAKKILDEAKYKPK